MSCRRKKKSWFHGVGGSGHRSAELSRERECVRERIRYGRSMMIRKIRCCELRSLCWIKDDDTFDASVGGERVCVSNRREDTGGDRGMASPLELKKRETIEKGGIW